LKSNSTWHIWHNPYVNAFSPHILQLLNVLVNSLLKLNDFFRPSINGLKKVNILLIVITSI